MINKSNYYRIFYEIARFGARERQRDEWKTVNTNFIISTNEKAIHYYQIELMKNNVRICEQHNRCLFLQLSQRPKITVWLCIWKHMFDVREHTLMNKRICERKRWSKMWLWNLDQCIMWQNTVRHSLQCLSLHLSSGTVSVNNFFNLLSNSITHLRLH